jgi:hypothetical protein
MYPHLTYRMGYYLLDDNDEPVPWPDGDVIGWAREWEKITRERRFIIKQEEIGPYRVSTVFLGLDHNFYLRGISYMSVEELATLPEPLPEPHIYETMVFGGDDYMERCGTRAGAIAQHERIANEVRLLFDATQGIDMDLRNERCD